MSADQLLVELPGSGRALFTTRADGNLSGARGEQAGRAAAARAELCARIGTAELAGAHQVHGASVRRWDSAAGASDGLEADGHATATPGLALMVLTADCLPIALGSAGGVAMLHAGWRGLAAGIVEEGVAALEEIGGGTEMSAVLGPCAGVCCYEVGPEVQAAFGREPVRATLNLREIARERLLMAGVEDVRELGACTICDERFFSHRREGERAGRQAGVAWLS